MKTLFKLIGMAFILGFIGIIMLAVFGYIYGSLGLYTIHFEWMCYLAIILLLFVLYRNKLQFFGWFHWKLKSKLSPRITTTLLICSTLLLVLLPVFSYLFTTKI